MNVGEGWIGAVSNQQLRHRKIIPQNRAMKRPVAGASLIQRLGLVRVSTFGQRVLGKFQFTGRHSSRKGMPLGILEGQPLPFEIRHKLEMLPGNCLVERIISNIIAPTDIGASSDDAIHERCVQAAYGGNHRRRFWNVQVHFFCQQVVDHTLFVLNQGKLNSQSTAMLAELEWFIETPVLLQAGFKKGNILVHDCTCHGCKFRVRAEVSKSPLFLSQFSTYPKQTASIYVIMR